MIDEETRAQIGGAVIALLLSLLVHVRTRLREGKRVLPRVRVRASFSIGNESDPPPPQPPAHEDEETTRVTPVLVRRRRRDADDEEDG